MSDQKPGLNLSEQQVKDLFVAMAKEIRRPADPTPKEQAQIENDRKMREDRGKMELRKIEAKRLEQSMCDHSREDGTGACVPVYDEKSTVVCLICQTCQALIHAEPRPTGEIGRETENHIYDTRLFNREYRRSMRRPSAMFQ